MGANLEEKEADVTVRKHVPNVFGPYRFIKRWNSDELLE